MSPAGLLGGAPVENPTQATPAAKPTAAPAAKPATAKPAAAATPAVATLDGGWPRPYTTPSGATFNIHQPQVASWANQKLMTFYAAVSYAAKPGDKPALGTIKAESDTKVSVSERLVDFSVLRVTESNFPSLTKPQIQEIVGEVTKGIVQQGRVIALDRVLASVDRSQIIPKNVEGVKANPPAVFFSKTPAVMVNIDEDPIRSPVAGTDLKYAINTNWDLFEYGSAKTFYLRHDSTWLKATSLEGPWTRPARSRRASRSSRPTRTGPRSRRRSRARSCRRARCPCVFVSTKPAELIMLKGEPSYLLVEGTSLLWVSNTESDVFRLGKAGTV